ncbi:MAG: TetR/AcrR family transcriptional regulator [Bacteroidales bacterium]|nr:TetR/AcrR family transcriptional regulator [Bacteroidales bacterium]MCF8333099.1 TetR/AcrR family transcriptional regulator [Bacteroidales bacterium]
MDERFEIILKEANKIFHTYGIKSISMDDLCRELKISKKTLYQYVDNKTDLLQQTIDYQFSKDNNKINAVMKQNHNAIDTLIEVSKMIYEELKKFQPNIIMFDLKKYFPETLEYLIDKKRRYFYDYIKGNLEQGIEEGLYRQDLNTDLITRLYIRKMEDMHDPDGFLNGDYTFEKIFEVMFDNHIRGIANEKGINYYEERRQKLKFNE